VYACECAVLIFEGHAGAKLLSFPATQPFTGIT
jgi:hypothetical protein